MNRDRFRYFRIEARELLEQMNRAVLDLERAYAAESLVQLLRQAHTLKGAARVVRVREIAESSHALEDLLIPCRDSGEISPEQIAGALRLLDQIAVALAQLGGEVPPDGAPVPAGVDAAGEEALAGKPDFAAEAESRLDQAALFGSAADASLETLLENFNAVRAQLDTLAGQVGRLERGRQLTNLLLQQLPAQGQGRFVAEELRLLLARLEGSLTQGFYEMDRDLRGAREQAESLQLARADALFTGLLRTARDTARELGKEVSFESRGGDVRLEAQVLVGAQRALLQAVRNAVAHGLETSSERLAAGKPRQGKVQVQVSRRGTRAVFRCRDDGRGLDFQAVRRAAQARRLPLPATPAEAWELLLRGGISTSPRVTEAAGRGVGMDLIRETARSLGGEVHLRSEVGLFTEIEVSVPVSLASLAALAVRSGGQRLLLPLDAVETTLRVETSQLLHSSGEMGYPWENGEILPYRSLSQAFGGSPEASTALALVVVHTGQQRVALGVEAVLEIAQVVLRPLPPLAPAWPYVAGLAVNTQGDPDLVIDPRGLFDEHLTPAPLAAPKSRPRILVVDDSLTTRMLEQSILESAGFVVDLACSGEEGLEKLQAQDYALILVDVEMPGIDGFTFLERLRKMPERAHIPALLVTSRAAPEDLARGRAAGAQGHVVKSEFDQKDLLERIWALVRLSPRGAI